MMIKPRWWLAAAMVFGLCAANARAGQPWKGVQILPKSSQVSIQDDNGAPVSMYDINWPATVLKTKGRYLWVQDDGGYSPTQVGGWIYSDDALRLDAAAEHFSNALRVGETAWLYWMRGICWEGSGDTGVAIVDYKNALRVEPNTGLDDIHMRLGRLFAQEQLQKGHGRYDAETRGDWENYFKTAEKINAQAKKPQRAQMYYEWGFALSQACSCTQASATAAAARKLLMTSMQKSPGNPPEPTPDFTQPTNGSGQFSGRRSPPVSGRRDSAPRPRPEQVTRGLEVEPEGSNEEPLPRQKPGRGPAESQPAANPAGGPSPSANEPIPSSAWQGLLASARGLFSSPAKKSIRVCAPVAPNAEGSEAALEALGKYQAAETLSPNWWRLPLARAELMLNQCDSESTGGDRARISHPDQNCLAQLACRHRAWEKWKSKPSAAPFDAVELCRNAEADADANTQTSDSAAAKTTDVIAIALDEFNRAISLNPNSPDAYRDRAEALRLANRLGEAKQSATTACNLCYFRDASSLRTLAQISYDMGDYQSAASDAMHAAELTSGNEKQRFLYLWTTYGVKAGGGTAKLASAAEQAGTPEQTTLLTYGSETAGIVASRGAGDEDDDAAGSTELKPPIEIEPPPGFLSRAGNASP